MIKNETDIPVQELIEQALKARNFSYVPYSGYAVGAALMAQKGAIYSGCNIENAAYGPTNCAERTAFFKAVSEGERAFRAIAICGGKKGEKPETYAYPCGVCRQVMKEFCTDDFEIIVAKSVDEFEIFTLSQLLPHGFGGENLA
ncbi:MAG: cytidine deaminase [Lachnospiraceae bacterium]|nr:cytidine deaminase [Lachnospiraceae bacterium]